MDLQFNQKTKDTPQARKGQCRDLVMTHLSPSLLHFRWKCFWLNRACQQSTMLLCCTFAYSCNNCSVLIGHWFLPFGLEIMCHPNRDIRAVPSWLLCHWSSPHKECTHRNDPTTDFEDQNVQYKLQSGARLYRLCTPFPTKSQPCSHSLDLGCAVYLCTDAPCMTIYDLGVVGQCLAYSHEWIGPDCCRL